MATHADRLVPLTAPKPVLRTDYRFLLFFGLHMAGFLASTLLMTWGVFVLFFFVLGGMSLDGMMNHLENMTSRYLAAGAARVDQFKITVGIVHLIVSGALIFFRRHAILPRDLAAKEPRA
jgi:hypothetical protein